jgi:hypothetical protein
MRLPQVDLPGLREDPVATPRHQEVHLHTQASSNPTAAVLLLRRGTEPESRADNSDS